MDNINIRLNNKKGHNPYFNRWFSAIIDTDYFSPFLNSHNPYFNRWFSAIRKNVFQLKQRQYVTILILIDGFLQFNMYEDDFELKQVTILILIDGFLQSLKY